ncbi:MAG: nucleotide pyrophosphatase, partial [bacterium]|nr:nucleotide pyrophosphatase [bacterium]
EGKTFDVSDGVVEQLKKISDNTTTYEGILKGPENPFKAGNPLLTIPFKLMVDKEKNSVSFQIGKEKLTIQPGKITDWINVEFKAGFIKISGLVQLVLESLDPVKLYVSPINIDPAKPSMPLSHPKILSVYLSKMLGPYATLGMAEDTSAVNEGVLSLESLLDQVYFYQEERERIFFDTFKKYKKGLMVQVFEATDRIQHMFWQFLEDPGLKVGGVPTSKRVKNAIYVVYKAMDDFLGELLPKLTDDDLLMIVSDHGFNSAKREFHLNSWLQKEGYLVLKDGKKTSGKWYADVDWSKSRAYGQGLNGLFLNIKGREKHGVVNAGKETEALKEEIKRKLINVTDEKTGNPVMKAVYKREELYKGPYVRNAPDVVVGYSIGHKVAWESAVNFVGGDIFSDNKKMWTGDHCFTSDQIPGIFFSNRKIKVSDPTLADISPTVLSAFGIAPPSFIDGRNLGVH